jgi:hypothetical protein
MRWPDAAGLAGFSLRATRWRSRTPGTSGGRRGCAGTRASTPYASTIADAAQAAEHLREMIGVQPPRVDPRPEGELRVEVQPAGAQAVVPHMAQEQGERERVVPPAPVRAAPEVPEVVLRPIATAAISRSCRAGLTASRCIPTTVGPPPPRSRAAACRDNPRPGRRRGTRSAPTTRSRGTTRPRPARFLSQ